MRHPRQSGFTLPEIMTALLIGLIVAALAVPSFMTIIHTARLRGAGTNFSGLLQSARIRAVQDNRFYSVYILTGGPEEAFVDIYPQSSTGVSGDGGTSAQTGDPVIVMSNEVAPITAANAPDTSNLKSQFLPKGSTLPVNDGNAHSSPITFSPRGLPCTSQTVLGGTVCDSAGGATAFWFFFQDNRSFQWEAITVSPAGRIDKWQFGQNAWSKV